jgi:ribonuclease PH
MEVKIKDEKLDAAVIQVVFDPLVGSSCTQERVLERIIRETFEALILKHLHPRTCIRLTCQVISEDGSVSFTMADFLSSCRRP